MAKALAVLRTIFLVFIVVYTLGTTTLALWGPEIVSVSPEALRRANRATWLAIAWIALDTMIGWVAVSWRRRASTRTSSPAPTSSPPSTRTSSPPAAATASSKPSPGS
jgi:hypothetical protein